MKKCFVTAIIIVIFLILPSYHVTADDSLLIPELNCEIAIIMDAATQNILYQKNAGQRAYPASTTKIITAALAIEMKSGTEKVTMSKYAVEGIGIDGSNARLKAGEVYTLDDLLNMALISSANDAANGIAEAVSGSTSNFVKLMNEKAKQLGLENTNFSNPIGLDVEDGYPEHLTTAKDLAILMRYATSMGKFREIIGKTEYQKPQSNSNSRARSAFKNTNLLITDSRYTTHDYTVIGGKTGYTKAAKNVFVGSAINAKGVELIIVLMKCPDRFEMFDDAKKLFDYGFGLVEKYPEIADVGFYDLRYRTSEKEINHYLKKGILTGSGNGAFNYDSLATREMFVKVLMEIRGQSIPTFSSYWSQPYLELALKEGIIDEEWVDKRNLPISRGEVIRCLGRLIDLGFKDSDSLTLAIYFNDFNQMDQELRNASLEVCILGIVPYINYGNLSAYKNLTREEMMLILSKFDKVMAVDAANMLY